MAIKGLIASVALLSGLTSSAAPLAKMEYSLDVGNLHKKGVLDLGSPGFDTHNHAYIRTNSMIYIEQNNKRISSINFLAAARIAIDRDIFHQAGAWDGRWDSSVMVDTAIVFDASDRAYTILVPRYSNLKQAVLLWSTDHGLSWSAQGLTGRAATIEKPDSYNDLTGPPTIISYENYGAYKGRHLWLDLFSIAQRKLKRSAPGILLSERSLIVPNHSGGGNSSFTTKKRIIVVYDVADDVATGTLSVAREINRATLQPEGREVIIGRSLTPKGPDLHDMPAITGDATGRLTVIIGAHHARLQVARTLSQRSIADGFTPLSPIGNLAIPQDSSFSYASLNTLRDGHLIIISRAEGDSYFYKLVEFIGEPGGENWRIWPNGYHYRVIATPHRQSYAAWRQRVTLDRNGRVYLNLRYYPNVLTPDEAEEAGVSTNARRNCRERDRCWYEGVPDFDPRTLVSNDGGLTWY